MKKAALAAVLVAAALGNTAAATSKLLDQYKKYMHTKHTNCASCHTEKMPKKDTAGLNDLGKQVQAAKKPDGTIDWHKVPKPAHPTPAPAAAPPAS